MNVTDYLAWYEVLVQQFGTIIRHQRTNYRIPTYWYDQVGAQAWASEAGSALASVFPASHPYRQTWDRLALRMRPEGIHGGSLEEMLGVITAATQQLRDKRIGSILD